MRERAYEKNRETMEHFLMRKGKKVTQQRLISFN